MCRFCNSVWERVYAWSFWQFAPWSATGLVVQQTSYASALRFLLGIQRLGRRALPRSGRASWRLGQHDVLRRVVVAGLSLRWNRRRCSISDTGSSAAQGWARLVSGGDSGQVVPEARGCHRVVIMGFGLGASLLTKGLAPFLVTRLDGDLALVFTWLGIIFACLLIPTSLLITNPPSAAKPKLAAKVPATEGLQVDDSESISSSLYSSKFLIMWLVFFFNISAGISIISVQSQLFQDVWRLGDPLAEPETLAQYGATLIAVSSLFNGAGRLFWASLSDRFGRTRVFRILLASQMVVFGVLMSSRSVDLRRARLLHPAVFGGASRRCRLLC